MFSHIAGPELDERIVWIVDDLAELLHRADMSAVLKDFGQHVRDEDPVIHFYETFLASYHPSMRELRGVYYTPEPVVSYIVRSVDHVLKKDFGLPGGLSDSTKIRIKTISEEKKTEVHKVQILDPAAGTGTFLHRVVDHIHESFKGNESMWSGYVSEHLLPRLWGFELLMAPYAVAHMKLALQLKQTGYDLKADERLRVYLTNSLEEARELEMLPLFAQWLGEETSGAGKVKAEGPLMVILGNPPYSGHSANKGKWIRDLLRGKNPESCGNYFAVDGHPLGERNPKWLNDDYVKFIRFAQWLIEKTGKGILALVTNHGYLDNPTFRGMRAALMASFSDVYLLNLHGSSKKKEQPPDGARDENVFDILQGTVIGIFVRRKAAKGSAQVRYGEIWGPRRIEQDGKIVGGKYHWLSNHDVGSTEWRRLEPESPYYLFVPRSNELEKEYLRGWRLSDAMPVHSVGIVTARDRLTIHWTLQDLVKTLKDFVSLPVEAARDKYSLGSDVEDWKVSWAQADLCDSGPVDVSRVVPILYRPFDSRYTYYTGRSRGFLCRPRSEVMDHMIAGGNLGLSTTRSIEIGRGWEHAFCSDRIIQHHVVSIKEVNYLFPLYLYPEAGNRSFPEPRSVRVPNLSPAFVTALQTALPGPSFGPGGTGDPTGSFGPEDIFQYIYAMLHSPSYRQRYREFLRIDFPRVPLTSQLHLFKILCALGKELVDLHLMTKHGPLITTYPEPGDNLVEEARYVQPGQGKETGRVWINKTQYVDGLSPEIWDFHIGGYQVSRQWLKDRKGRRLSYEELAHYQGIVSALGGTAKLMGDIDAAILSYGGFPLT